MPNVQYFLGANSPQGFYSLYDQLICPEQARAIYILKGGPGCGKSTLMRRVGALAEQAGVPVEYIICSGDPASLDGVILPTLDAALGKLKDALKGTGVAAIKAATEELSKAFYPIIEKLYSQAGGPQAGGPDMGGAGFTGGIRHSLYTIAPQGGAPSSPDGQIILNFL